MKRLYWLAGSAALLAVLGPPGRAQAAGAVSRETTYYNAPLDDAPRVHAVSREITYYNVPDEAAGRLRAVSREVSYLNDSSFGTQAAVSREVTGYLAPYAFGEAVTALRIAAGIAAAGAPDAARLDVVTGAPSAGRVDVLDAFAVIVLALHADPGM